MSRIPIVMFAQVPPPEHGQSRMVMLALESLRRHPEAFEVHHVNARFSASLEEIGESSIAKIALTAKYLIQAIRIRTRIKDPLLYYVPGPVKWSSVLRDWVLLSVLRLFYSRMIFHWHAIGHGEWAHGSDRLSLEGPRALDRVARKISAWALDEPFASIAVSANSRKDSLAVGSKRNLVLCNGIEDPCVEIEEDLISVRLARQREIASESRPTFKILFLSYGTVEKGILDALECLDELLNQCDPSWLFQITFAGGVSDSVRLRFDSLVWSLEDKYPQRIQIIECGYLTGDAKRRSFVDHDIFLAPSRWESFGLTVIEAMAYRLPIVAAASDGVQGVLPDNYPYLAPVANPSALAAKLMECCLMLRDREVPNPGAELRKHFLSSYQIKHFSENLIQVFLRLGADGCGSALPLQERDDKSVVSPYPESSASPIGVHSSSSSDLRPSTFRPSDSSSSPSSLPLLTDLSVIASATMDHCSLITSPKIRITAYLADQNPGHDRSFGISRMSQVVLEALQAGGGIGIEAITSKTSQQAPDGVGSVSVLPWGTRRKWVRLMTDHLHPLFQRGEDRPDLYYFPKGYLPLLNVFCRPSVVTIHDTIIQYDADHYPKWRSHWEYGYWARMLKHTLRHADRILTVSESSKRQIHDFMERHRIPAKEIMVTYEPCAYEQVPQPAGPAKENYVIHLASVEPHKRTSHLIRWWHAAESQGRGLPMLHLIGTVPEEVAPLLASSRSIMKRPFLEDAALQAAYQAARALILPSEIEGFGLPALEAYYLGTPVCFVEGTSVEEILSVATDKGAFSLDDAESLFEALDEVMAMSPGEVRECGLKLRETYAAEKVAERMLSVFREVKNR